MSILLQASKVLNESLGHFIYHLVLLLAVQAAMGMAWGEWKRSRREWSRRLLIATAGLLLVRVSYFIAALFTQTRWMIPETLLPPLEQFVNTASIALLGWAFMPPPKRGKRTWDLVFGGNLLVAVGLCAVFTVTWSRAWIADPTLDYNTFWQSTVWAAWQMALIFLAILGMTRNQGEGWGTMITAMALMFVGEVLQLVYPQGVAAPNVPTWQRLANLIAYPLLVVGIYQHIFAHLRVHSRQLQNVSQASLDQIKSLLYLFEAGQRMSSSLDLSTVLENAAEGVARTLDADQCAIAVPSDNDPSQMRLAAIYNPARQGRGEVATFPLGYQLAVQQAMRRKTHVIVEQSDNVQLRALFALLGSSQTGPLLVQPLLSSGEAIGAIIVGNALSHRPFAPNEAKLCQAIAEQVVTAIQNARRYRLAQDKIAEMSLRQKAVHGASQEAQAQVQDLTAQLADTQTEIEALRQARNALEIKLVSSRAEADTLTKRLALLGGGVAAEDALWQGMARAGLQDIAAGMLLTDGEGRIRTTNALAEALLGRSGEELRGQELALLSGDEEWRQALLAARHGEAVRLTLQIGATPLMCDVAPLSDPTLADKPTGFAVILQGLLPEAEGEQARLETVVTMLDELHPPVTTIIGYADLLLSEAMGSVGEVQRKFLLRIKAGAKRMATMIEELSKEAAGESPQQEQKSQRVQLDELVEGAVSASRVQIEDKTLALDLNLPNDLPTIKADPDYLQRVVSCLLSNACLASPVGGRIQVQAAPSTANGLSLDPSRGDRDSNGFVTIAVKDSGGGIPDDALQRVFERTRPSQTPQGLGESGAGLAMVKALVEANGGQLSVESARGEGTTFRFVFPVSGQSDQPVRGSFGQ